MYMYMYSGTWRRMRRLRQRASNSNSPSGRKNSRPESVWRAYELSDLVVELSDLVNSSYWLNRFIYINRSNNLLVN